MRKSAEKVRISPVQPTPKKTLPFFPVQGKRSTTMDCEKAFEINPFLRDGIHRASPQHQKVMVAVL